MELEQEARKISGKRGEKSASEILGFKPRDAWTPAEPLELYTRSSAGWRKRVIESGLFPLPPGESLKVMPVAEFMRDHFPTAAYSSPGPFLKKQRNLLGERPRSDEKE